jgi:sugar lactone lactonase YvrE
MTWNFKAVAGPFPGALGGVVWDGKQLLFSLIDEMTIKQYDPVSGNVSDFRRHTGRVNGITLEASSGIVSACQEGGRRVIQYLPDGSATVTATRFMGAIHNHPNDLVVDSQSRLWFSDPHNGVQAFGPQVFPPLEHASVMRLERDDRRAWVIRRVTFDTVAPRAVLLSRDEKTLYVSEGTTGSLQSRELRAYAVKADGTVDRPRVLHTFGKDDQGAHRGIEGLCEDADGNILACGGWRQSGSGPLVYVFSPAGHILETHPLPFDAPVRLAFGDAQLDSLYVTGGDGQLHVARHLHRRGHRSV